VSSLELHEAVPSSVLAIYAHPDDADVAAAGTLSRWTKAGATVHLLVVADGGRGSVDPAAAPAETAARRAEELREACAITGASFSVLGMADGEIANDAALRARLVAEVRALRPDVVLSHDPTAVFFGRHYFNHADHRALGWAVLDAVAPAAAMPHYFPEAGAPHAVSEILLSGTLEPNCAVDVSSYLDAKVAAVACHRSQFHDHGDAIGDVLRHRAAEEGRRAGLKAAETFRSLRPNG
jgi:LmbE family N-acetylglucosaminyl deacetylase